MKLILYSGGYFRDNQELNYRLRRLVGHARPSMTFIPSCSEFGKEYFTEFTHHFDPHEFGSYHYMPVDTQITKDQLKALLSSDIVFLSGGNTFYFLHHLRRSGMLDQLHRFVREGGVLSGLSAGGILMTRNIALAGYPSFDCDENELGLKNLKALDLVDFDFFPHYAHSRRYIEAFESFSRKSKRPLIACPDGSGVVLEDAETILIGEPRIYFQGKHMRL